MTAIWCECVTVTADTRTTEPKKNKNRTETTVIILSPSTLYDAESCRRDKRVFVGTSRNYSTRRRAERDDMERDSNKQQNRINNAQASLDYSFGLECFRLRDRVTSESYALIVFYEPYLNIANRPTKKLLKK